MNPYLEPQGFLGTGASLLADLTLVAYILILIPAMLIGLSYARRGKHRPQHKNVMTFVTIANWVLIVFLMFAAYRFDIADNITRQPTNLRYLLPTIHGVLGLPAQLLATFILARMFIEDRAIAAAKKRGETQVKPYFWKLAKPVMQTTLALWLATALLGIASYVIRYNIIQTPLAPGGAAPGNVQPVVTPEVVSTPELMSTDEMMSTEDVVMTAEVALTDAPTAGPGPTLRPTIAFNFGAAATAPAVTEELMSTDDVAVTPEAMTTTGEPLGWLVFTRPAVIAVVAATPEVIDTPEIAVTAEVAATPDVVSTPEVDDDSGGDDDGGQGRGRGRGRGGDDDSSGGGSGGG